MIEPLPRRCDSAWQQRLRQRLADWDVLAMAPNEGGAPAVRAAVALAITEAAHGANLPGLPMRPRWNGAPALILTRRAARMRSHAGQWALPGGRVDPGETVEQAALRELAEEVGLRLSPGAVMGRLDDFATRSGYIITPVVVWAGAATRMKANPDEVGSIHRIPLAEFLRPDAPLLDKVSSSDHPMLRMPVGHQWIAAPTGALIYQFCEVLLRGRPTRVAHFEQPRFAWR